MHHKNGYKWRDYYKYNKEIHRPYDYAREGLLKQLLPQRYIESKNTVFQAALKVIEVPFTFLLKQIDILNNFKNYHWWNY